MSTPTPTNTNSSICSPKLLLLFFLLSAIPISFLISLELSLQSPSTHTYSYHSTGYFRECVKYDDLNRRFLVSFIEGGVGQIKVPEDENDTGTSSVVLEETRVVENSGELAGNASLGMVVDKERNRVLVVIADVLGNKFNGLAAYDLKTWERLFLTQLTAPEKSFADDVTVDTEGNAYVTDAKSSKIWKLNVDGKLLKTIRNPLFEHKQWYNNVIALNGILYHPDGYLLVIHTVTGKLFKINPQTEEVKLVKVVKGSLRFGDAMEFVSKDKVVVAAMHPTARLVESKDGWETAEVVGKFVGPVHRVATGVTVKDGRAYLSHLVGLGYPKKRHVLVEALFKDV